MHVIHPKLERFCITSNCISFSVNDTSEGLMCYTDYHNKLLAMMFTIGDF